MTATGTGRRAGGPSPLTVWLVSRVALVVVTVATTWTVADTTVGRIPSFLSRWDRWDVGLFVKIARWGYFGYPAHYPDRGVVAIFPGEPLLLRAVHWVVPSWIAAGLLISLVAGGIAVVALARLADLEGGAVGRVDGLRDRAVLYLVLSPYAVFLAAGYSEALFLALALPSWLAARQGRWRTAGLVGALAGLVRVSGVFLGAALVVEYVVQRRRRVGPDALWTLGPWAAAAGYSAWLAARTGDWLAWLHAQSTGWHRNLTAPWTSLSTTWHAATAPGQPAAFAWSFRADIVAVAIGVVLTVVLLRLRRWAEATYVGLQVIAFATSSYYLSVARATLLWWPLWLLLAAASLRRRWVHVGYLALASPLMVVLAVAFIQGHWVN